VGRLQMVDLLLQLDDVYWNLVRSGGLYVLSEMILVEFFLLLAFSFRLFVAFLGHFFLSTSWPGLLIVTQLRYTFFLLDLNALFI
jgi:hypothetical protein